MKALRSATAVITVSLLMSGCAAGLMRPAPSEQVSAPAADFMLAKLAGGKTYYSIVRPNWGTGGFAPTPIRNASASEAIFDSPEFRDWNSAAKRIEPNEQAPGWFRDNKARMQQIYAEYWKRFQTKTDQEKAFRTLMPEDGR
jgi:hypothetical protein